VLGSFALISGVTIAGALLIAALLAELPFLIKTSAFAGVKLAAVGPVILLGMIYLAGISNRYDSPREEFLAVQDRLQRFLAEPMRLWHAAALLTALVLLSLLLARSGNDSGLAVSATELRFRALLDQVVGVRPRTKEFLLGHPALLLGLALAYVPRWRMVALPLLLVGVIGQTGMLNSFCHLHSPLKVTVLRTVNGLWTGGILGLVLIWLSFRLPFRLTPKQ
jgi:hypothetical protein